MDPPPPWRRPGMSRPSDPTIPTSITPASIALIEADASRTYGIPLKHVPDEDEDQPDEEPAKAKAPVKKPPPKTSSKPATKPKGTQADLWTDEQREAAILNRLAKGELKATSFYDLWPAPELARKGFDRMRLRLIKQGKIKSKGSSRGMAYTLAD